MKNSRREFIKRSALATTGTMLIPGFLKALESKVIAGDKKLVILQLSGGNDGLNTIVPYRNDLYYQLRPQLGISPEKVLKVSDELGFHPALASLRSLYDDGYLAVLNNVGYPNPDRSHFRSMDIWTTASDAHEYLYTGWLGRYLDATCVDGSGAHKAIEIDDMLSLALKGERCKGMAMRNPKKLYDALHGNLFQKLAENGTVDHTDEPSVSYLYKTLAESVSSSGYIYSKSKIVKTRAEYPETEFASQLKTIAQLIISGIDTRVYYASLSGFDTHARQLFTHERHLGLYANAVKAFVDDLEENNAFDNVLIMTFSEFGRRVSQNAGEGTDHGTANNLFLISKSLKQKGFINETPDLKKLDNGDLIHTVDFRSVYATILDQWLGADSEKILGSKFRSVGFI
ncbi:MAG TPA: DUF1501 domain-containing protein [Cyclobacteriaceae bacterium]|nr:DUF1501 domain-containing protein [Cyclobacteriaceae bacterium]